jgi:hypothetical protein
VGDADPEHPPILSPIRSTNVTLCYLPLEIGGADSERKLKSIDSTYLAIGALWLVLGMILGIVMGASENFLFMPVHAHINLIGFACHSIFGMAYRQWPTMKASGLALYQFWIFVISTPITLIGLAFTLTGGPALPTIIGSFGLLIGAALFCFLAWRTLLVAAD